MDSVAVSAPGKLMLLGDHAVVHNHPCLVAAIDQRFHLQATVIPEHKLILNAPKLGLINYQKPLDNLMTGEVPKSAEYIEYAVGQFNQKYPLKLGIKIDTAAEQMDPKFGFGTSAAATVSTTKALGILFDQELDKRAVFDLSYHTVQHLKGVGSGFDMASAVYGGFLYFVTGGAAIKPLGVDPLKVVVAYSGYKADTPLLIRVINEQVEMYPDIVHNVFDVSEKIVERGLEDLEASDMVSFGKMMSMHQGLLTVLGVSTSELDTICRLALDAGAYGAKLSGAGGGDCAIAIAGLDKIKSVAETLRQAGFDTMVLEAGSEGVRVEVDPTL